ncbi:MAG: polyisoprenoid-binding protein [Alphaproteobacteria bacterium]|nr:polyisoprenoid-binding protein [Alphaproteobacteria bacterium]
MNPEYFLKTAVSALLLLCASCAGLAQALAPNVNPDPTALKAGNYVLDHKHAALVFKVDHLGFSNYVGRFNRFDVSLDFDETDPAAARVEAVIDMTSLDIANDEFANVLMGPSWFDANQFPEAILRSTGIEITGDNTGVMTGDLTMHGVTHPVTINVTFNGGGNDRLRGAYIIGMSASATIDRNDFGVDRYGGIVGDMVEIAIEAEFERQ